MLIKYRNLLFKDMMADLTIKYLKPGLVGLDIFTIFLLFNYGLIIESFMLQRKNFGNNWSIAPPVYVPVWIFPESDRTSWSDQQSIIKGS